MREISWFVSGEQINYLPKSKAEANNWSVLSFGDRICFLMNIFGKRSDLPFLRKSDHKKEKSVASFKHEQNINCSQTYPNTWAKPQRRLLSAHALTFLGFSYFSQNRQIWAAEIDHLNFEGADYPSTGRR